MSYIYNSTESIYSKVILFLTSINVILNDIQKENLKSTINSYFEEMKTRKIELSSIKPDYEFILEQLTQELEQTKTWKDRITSSTGQTIISLISAVGAFSQFAIERALQEAFPDTAKQTSSIYAIARMLGVRIRRKYPASVSVALNNASTSVFTQIPKFSQFTIAGNKFFNRDPITFNIGVSQIVGVKLYQGEIKNSTFVSNGEAYQLYDVGDEDYSISEEDLAVTVGIDEYRKIEVGLYQAEKLEKVFYENTAPSGNVEIQFGNDIYGKIPPISQNIFVRWASTLGNAGNNSNLNLSVTTEGLSNITGITTSTIVGGSDEKDAEFYRLMSPSIYGAKNRAVARKDYEAIAMEYPGVFDAKFRGQEEIAPNDLRYMRVAEVSLLTKEVWTNDQWNDFKNFIKSKGIVNLNLVRRDPTQLVMDITATINCIPNANLAEIKRQLETEIKNIIKPRRYAIGYSYYLSDIHDILEGTDELRNVIQFVNLTTPSTDFIATNLEYVSVGTINLTMQYTTRESSGLIS
jgi:hypothetical protein